MACRNLNPVEMNVGNLSDWTAPTFTLIGTGKVVRACASMCVCVCVHFSQYCMRKAYG